MPRSSDNRKKKVFRAIVREYVETAEPVGSGTIVIKYNFGVSPATIRNDMAELESEGLLEQPHTSAGRVPTERGYRFYVEEFAGRSELSARERRHLAEAAAALDAGGERVVKEFARMLASLADQTVVISLDPVRTYLTGMSNLVRQPEFHELEPLSTLSRAIDDLDRVVDDLRRRLDQDIEVLIGGENPFGESLSTVAARCQVPGGAEGLIGILGPKRMDYDASMAMIRCLREIFSGR